MASPIAMVTHVELRPLARYLEDVGYVVQLITEPSRARTDATLVWRLRDEADENVADTVRLFLGVRGDARAVLVCEQPGVLRERIDDARVWVVPAPVTGLQLVEVLRDALSPGRGA